MFAFHLFHRSQLVSSEVPIRGTLSLGRAPSSDIVIEDDGVELHHLTIRVERAGQGELVVVSHAGGAGETTVNGRRIQERIVVPGDIIQFGDCRLEILCLKDDLLSSIEDDPRQKIVFKGDPFEAPSAPERTNAAIYSLLTSISVLEVPEMLDRAAGIIRSCISYDQLCFLLLRSEEIHSCAGWDRKGRCDVSSMRISRSIVDACLSTGQPVISENIQKGAETSGSDGPAVAGMYSSICVPLKAASRNLGVLYCSSRNPFRWFRNEDARFLMLVASVVGVGISHLDSLREAQLTTAKIEAILCALQEGLIVCDSRYRVLSANDAARDLLECPCLVGRGLEESLEKFDHDLRDATGAIASSFDIRRRQSGDGLLEPAEERVYHGTISATEGLEQGDSLCVVSLHDVSHERWSERVRIAFLDRLGHKLRTPLTVMKGVTTLIGDELRGMVSEELQALFSLAAESCDHMSQLVDRLIDFAWLGQRQAEHALRPMAVSLKYLSNQALRMAEEDVRRSEIQVDDQLAASDVVVMVDPESMVRCFHQIIQNTCKFAGKGAGLHLSMERRDDLIIRFTDSGRGIPPGEIERVFDLFYQVDSENTGEVPGVGLGLWWCRNLVRGHGGEIRIASPPKGSSSGTSVEICLPGRSVIQSAEIASERGSSTAGETSGLTAAAT
ncbi:MAG: GAF domain-containing protein [Planctomycetes bacterium]|nr:GAF domain-containing protein [Planctomycetota bacterium]